MPIKSSLFVKTVTLLA